MGCVLTYPLACRVRRYNDFQVCYCMRRCGCSQLHDEVFEDRGGFEEVWVSTEGRSRSGEQGFAIMVWGWTSSEAIICCVMGLFGGMSWNVPDRVVELDMGVV